MKRLWRFLNADVAMPRWWAWCALYCTFVLAVHGILALI